MPGRTCEREGARAAARTSQAQPAIETLDAVLDRIGRSTFRAKFHLGPADARYARERGKVQVESHAVRFVVERLAAANPDNDGRQTPMRGHPVFRAQHATATCCRGCLAKHHGIVKHHPLTDEHIGYVVAVIMRWIERELMRACHAPAGAGATTRPAATTRGDRGRSAQESLF